MGQLQQPQIKSKQSAISNARGYIERMEEDDSGVLRVQGWMHSLTGPFQSIAVQIEDQSFPVKQIYREGIEKSFPFVPNAAASGFEFSVPVGDFFRTHPEGVLQFTLIGSNDGKETGAVRGGYYRSSVVWQAPAGQLMKRVANTKHAYNFYASGMKACVNLLSYASRHVSLAHLGKVLDWGCGSGRLTPHLLHCLPNAEIYGTDIDREAVEWTAAKYPRAHICVCQPAPPLPYDSSSFDLILAGSVFTHLTQRDQLHWLEEMRRLLSSDGLLLATTHGEFAGRFSLPKTFEKVFSSGFSDEQRDNVLDGIAPTDYYRATFQSKEHTMKVWGKTLEIVDHIEAGYANFQDVFILRKRRRLRSFLSSALSRGYPFRTAATQS